MNKKKAFIILGLIIVLSLVDIGANFLNNVPIIGAILETTSETVLETIQVGLTALLVTSK